MHVYRSIKHGYAHMHYIYECTYVHAYAYICLCIPIYAHILICTHVYVYMCTLHLDVTHTYKTAYIFTFIDNQHHNHDTFLKSGNRTA